MCEESSNKAIKFKWFSHGNNFRALEFNLKNLFDFKVSSISQFRRLYSDQDLEIL